MSRRTPRERYSSLIRREIFGDGRANIRTPSQLSELTGISVNTIKAWARDPGRMPAYQYLRFKEILK